MRHFVAILVLAGCCFAQAKGPVRKSQALTKCESTVNTLSDVNGQLWMDRSNAEQERDKAKTESEDLRAKNAELSKQLADLQSAGRDVLAYAERLQTEYKALSLVYEAMVDRLNSQTDARLARNTRAMERMAASAEENARMNRATAIFGIVQGLKPAPYTPLPLPAPPLHINCNSQQIGNSTYTDCH